jgi:transcription elongation GreA/GreB family factor
MKDKELKAGLLAYCQNFVEQKYQTLLSEYRIYQDSAANETKSTAGDKHDTSKSMMQLEQEKLGQQMKQLIQQKKILENLDIRRVTDKVEFGCVVETDNGNFFMSISAREIEIGNKIYIPVSMQSPLAMAMLNHCADDQVVFNGKAYTIKSVY